VLLRQADAKIALLKRLAGCFTDHRDNGFQALACFLSWFANRNKQLPVLVSC